MPRKLRASVYRLLLASFRSIDWSISGSIAGREEELAHRGLQQLLEHAGRHVPYYRDLGVRQCEFSQIPLLTKNCIHQQLPRLRSSVDDGGAELNSSGGSTGEPVMIWQDARYRNWSLATKIYYYRNLLGIDYSSASKVKLWGSERDIFRGNRSVRARLASWLSGTCLLNTFQISESRLAEYVAIINRRRPELIHAYAGSLLELVRHVKRTNVSIHRPRCIISSAETLTSAMRAEIESTLGARIFNFYGSREVGPIAGECAQGQMHVFQFFNAVEYLAEQDRPGASNRKAARIVVTNLHNYTMPLIRYEMGDLGIAGGRCSCGSSLPVLREIVGRTSDHLINGRNEKIHGEFVTHLFYFRSWIQQFQLLQTERNSVSILFVGNDPPDGERADIEQKLRIVMGPECRIRWEKVNTIPATPQGKRRFVRSLVTVD